MVANFLSFYIYVPCKSDSAFPLQRYSLFPQSLNVSWPHDQLWPTECIGSDGMLVLSPTSINFAHVYPLLESCHHRENKSSLVGPRITKTK